MDRASIGPWVTAASLLDHKYIKCFPRGQKGQHAMSSFTFQLQLRLVSQVRALWWLISLGVIFREPVSLHRRWGLFYTDKMGSTRFPLLCCTFCEINSERSVALMRQALQFFSSFVPLPFFVRCPYRCVSGAPREACPVSPSGAVSGGPNGAVSGAPEGVVSCAP